MPVGRVFGSLLSFAPELTPPFATASLMDENGKKLLVVEDLRGRPPETFAGPDRVPRTLEKPEEELFRAEGAFFHPPETLDAYPVGHETLRKSPFQYRLGTRFHHFTNGGHIVHEVVSSSSPSLEPLAPQLKPEWFSRLLPADLQQVRLGFESYKPSMWSALPGTTPSVENRWYLEIESSGVFLLAEEDGLRNARLPFEKCSFISSLSRALEQLNLFYNLPDHLEKAL